MDDGEEEELDGVDLDGDGSPGEGDEELDVVEERHLAEWLWGV